MSIISTIKQGLNATEELTVLPFKLTQDVVGDNDSITGRFLQQVSQISQSVSAMPIQIAKNLLDETPQEKNTNRSHHNRERLNRWNDDGDKFENLGRS